ncbi:MAG: VOC family protein [Gammaproteobacteria bacterium]|nr:VOC family protein [Gammaproteobacteria bacterium]NVK87749.1 VOC family protein [Gammaproteobacteria bacterium]
MQPSIQGIDHLHVYVNDKTLAVKWFQDTLGFRPLSKFQSWNTQSGPLMIGDQQNRALLALFESSHEQPSRVIAFGCSAENFIQWRAKLTALDSLDRLADHEISFSLYFTDPFGNQYEITCHDHQTLSGLLYPEN